MDIALQWLHQPFSRFFLGELVVLGLLLAITRAHYLRRSQPERWRQLCINLPAYISLTMATNIPGLFHDHKVWAIPWGIVLFGLLVYGYRLSLRSIRETNHEDNQGEVAQGARSNNALHLTRH